jgi:hypothetical protein
MVRTQIKTPGIADDAVTAAKLDSTVSGALVPIGGIIMWSGSVATIPSSWRLCNGTNGTPNLQDKFVIGAGSGYAVGASAGSADATLVSHSHTAISSVSDPGHAHSYTSSRLAGAVNDSPQDDYIRQQAETTGSSLTGITVGTTISTEGSPATNANLPPYYALAFIMRIS